MSTTPRGRAGARGARSSSRGRASSRSGGGNQAMLFGGIAAAAVVVVVLVVVMRGGEPATGGAKPAPAAARSAAPAAPAPRAVATPELGGTARQGKQPDRPAPPIAAADLERAGEFYAAGVAKWNEAQAARNKGDTGAYAAALDEAFDALTKQRDAIRPYTDWFEEADIEGWAMPAEYDGLQKLLNKWDPTYQRVKKLKQSD